MLAVFDGQATEYTWTGAQESVPGKLGNWNTAPVFTASDALYFSQYASESASRVVEISSALTIGSLVFGAETGGTGNPSIIGSNTTPLRLRVFSGSVARSLWQPGLDQCRLWLQSGAGANGFYYSIVAWLPRRVLALPSTYLAERHFRQ